MGHLIHSPVTSQVDRHRSCAKAKPPPSLVDIFPIFSFLIFLFHTREPRDSTLGNTLLYFLLWEAGQSHSLEDISSFEIALCLPFLRLLRSVLKIIRMMLVRLFAQKARQEAEPFNIAYEG